MDVNRELFAICWRVLSAEAGLEEAWQRFQAERLPEILGKQPVGSAPAAELLRARFDEIWKWVVAELAGQAHNE